jgi:hypothetical protein
MSGLTLGGVDNFERLWITLLQTRYLWWLYLVGLGITLGEWATPPTLSRGKHDKYLLIKLRLTHRCNRVIRNRHHV